MWVGDNRCMVPPLSPRGVYVETHDDNEWYGLVLIVRERGRIFLIEQMRCPTPQLSLQSDEYASWLYTNIDVADMKRSSWNEKRGMLRSAPPSGSTISPQSCRLRLPSRKSQLPRHCDERSDDIFVQIRCGNARYR